MTGDSRVCRPRTGCQGPRPARCPPDASSRGARPQQHQSLVDCPESVNFALTPVSRDPRIDAREADTDEIEQWETHERDQPRLPGPAGAVRSASAAGSTCRRGLPGPVCCAHPHVDTSDWTFEISGVSGTGSVLTWADLMALPNEEFTVDLHCVAKWNKLQTHWRGVPMRALLGDVASAPSTLDHAMFRAYGGYTTNLPLHDLVDLDAWIAFEYEGEALKPAHGGPARLLVPHLYLWKSAKWVKGIHLCHGDRLGFWESFGYHAYGDPWREERYVGD
jgi:DMSO/TMAO reductase YedYZ molybdopterin-dependent catalytic subunit